MALPTGEPAAARMLAVDPTPNLRPRQVSGELSPQFLQEEVITRCICGRAYNCTYIVQHYYYYFFKFVSLK